MWRRIEVNATVDHPVERVFAYLANPLLWHEFAPAVVFRRQIGVLPPDIGTRWMATDQIGPFRFHFVDELAELELGRRVVWLSSAPWNARVEYLCTADGGRTRVLATYEGDVVGFLRVLVGWLPTRVFGWFLARDFSRMNRVLSREMEAAHRWHGNHPNGVPEPDAADLFPGVDSGRPAPAE
jgi:Polyketide cyclase / dehydrase and lipid transport